MLHFERLKAHITPQSILSFAPGRINLIGEHTAYNEGFVLPAAIQLGVRLVLTPRSDQLLNLVALDKNETMSVSLNQVQARGHHWTDYLFGVIAQFLKKGMVTHGFDFVFTSDVPMGAGLSSSAAIECAVAVALNEYYQNPFTPLELALIAQKAEHEFAGVQCGIMDQFASIFGKKNHILRLDCKSMQHEYLEIQLGKYEFILLDTSLKHNLASSEYNIRRQQCAEGVALIQQQYPEVRSLRDVSWSMLQLSKPILPPLIYKRCAYVLQENERLMDACFSLQQGDMLRFGKLLYQTHEGLSKEYEVSCLELDFLVAETKKYPDAIMGARMMGGGFGGCTLNVIHTQKTSQIVPQLIKAYHQATQRDLAVYAIQIEDGARAYSSSDR